jgi:tight adherence protein B
MVIFVGTAASVWAGYRPIRYYILRREEQYDEVLRGALLMNVAPRTVTVLSGLGMVALAATGYLITESDLGLMIGLALGLFLPSFALRWLRRRRTRRLEDQIVGGIQTLASGVRAGLNLVQAMELVARDGPVPLKQEFAHLLREYEYGVSLEDAMDKAAQRIGSTDFRLLFSALQTHRERGGNLGETLDRIGAAVREIQRLEARAQTLTAQGRATARWLGAMPLVVLTILYFIDSDGVKSLFEDPLGKLIVAVIVVLNLIGFLWIKKIVAIDI